MLACFVILQQLWSIHQCVFRPVVQSLMLLHLDYGNATPAGIPAYLRVAVGAECCGPADLLL